PALVALDTDAFSPLWRLTSREMVEFLVTSGHFVVAERSGEVVGYACSNVQRDVGQVYRLAVHPDEQGQGIGQILLADALSYCQNAGAFLVMLNTQQSNRQSERLYRRFGFQPTSQRIPVMMGRIPSPADHPQTSRP
ncbi:MAG: GNAT family N-acetyltransferase, partial [Anaerolineae bacterium]|nr:GNAT family N-acetyltransferase [Anaerolineae bacterium]